MKKFNIFIGSSIYLSLFIGGLTVPYINSMLIQAFDLAFTLSVMMLVAYIYFGAISSYGIIKSNKRIIASQSKLAASTVVSLGLIGTFLGLTSMITSISSSIGGEDSNALMTSIGSALGAMNYAFLTSILGVAVSLLILLASNFFEKAISIEDSPLGQSLESKFELLVDKNKSINLLRNGLDELLESQFKLLDSQKEVLSIEQKLGEIRLGIDALVSLSRENNDFLGKMVKEFQVISENMRDETNEKLAVLIHKNKTREEKTLKAMLSYLGD